MQATIPSDESTPLLTDHAHLEAQQSIKKQTPLPKAQLAALCISRLTDPVAYTQIFPYINEFLILLHVTDDVSKIGFYSGLVVGLFDSRYFQISLSQESTFAISQTITIYHWAKLSGTVAWFIASPFHKDRSRCCRPSLNHPDRFNGTRGRHFTPRLGPVYEESFRQKFTTLPLGFCSSLNQIIIIRALGNSFFLSLEKILGLS